MFTPILLHSTKDSVSGLKYFIEILGISPETAKGFVIFCIICFGVMVVAALDNRDVHVGSITDEDGKKKDVSISSSILYTLLRRRDRNNW